MTIKPAGSGGSQASTVVDAPSFAWRSDGYAWYVTAVLTLAFMLAMLDRMLLVLLVEPIKADLSLSDTELSLLHGFAFTILYMIFGVPLAWLADRGRRIRVATVSIMGWSIATALCGATSSFWPLFAARMAVGVGEAGLSPAANSIIADYFPRERAARPIAYYSLGGTAGSGVALIFGSGIIAFLLSHPLVLPLVGQLRPWQSAFALAGLAGIAFAILMCTVKEPPRQATGLASDQSEPGSLSRLVVHRATFLAPHMIGSSLAAAAILGMHSWMPTLLIRRFGWTVSQSGFQYGLVVLISSLSGVLISGTLVERFRSRGVKAPAATLARGAVIFALPFAVAAPLMPFPSATLMAVGVALCLLSIPVALAPVALQLIATPTLRGQIYAVYVLIMSLIAYIGAPTLVAVLTDYLFKDEGQVGSSLALLAGGCLAGAGFLLTVSRRRNIDLNLEG